MAFDRRFAHICPPIPDTVAVGAGAPFLVEPDTYDWPAGIQPNGVHYAHALKIWGESIWLRCVWVFANVS